MMISIDSNHSMNHSVNNQVNQSIKSINQQSPVPGATVAARFQDALVRLAACVDHEKTDIGQCYLVNKAKRMWNEMMIHDLAVLKTCET